MQNGEGRIAKFTGGRFLMDWVRGQYILDVMVKLETRSAVLKKAKEIIMDASIALRKEKGFSSVRVIIDVDPL